MNKLTWIILAFAAGAFLPLQAGLNAKMAKSIQSPVYASLISFLVGMLALVSYVLITRQSLSVDALRTAPAYAWGGGVLGAFYVTVIVLAFPRIGPALTFGLIVAGQMVISVTLDHFHILVAQKHSFNLWRLLGIALIIGGVIIIRKF